MHLEHPDISRIQATGLWPDDDGVRPVCPVCGRECEYAFVDRSQEVMGCEHCIEKKNANEVLVSNAYGGKRK